MQNKHLLDEIEYYSNTTLKEVDLSHQQDEYDLFDSSDDAGNELDFVDLLEYVLDIEKIDDGIDENNFNFMEV